MILGPGFMCGNGHGVKPGEAVPCPWCEIESLKGHVRRLERSNQTLGEENAALTRQREAALDACFAAERRLGRMQEITGLAGGYQA